MIIYKFLRGLYFFFFFKYPVRKSVNPSAPCTALYDRYYDIYTYRNKTENPFLDYAVKKKMRSSTGLAYCNARDRESTTATARWTAEYDRLFG